MKNKKIVCFGGGSAMPKAVLEDLKEYGADIVSVTSMADDGGSTGQLREEFGVLPPGDVRRHILAFSDAPKWKKELWNFRFGNEEFAGGHKGHNFANVFIAGLEKSLKNYDEVLEKCYEFMEVKKNLRVMPATTSKVTLCAEMEDGSLAEGEGEIDVPKNHSVNLKIKKIFLKSKAIAYKKLITEIKNADVIIIGPGDLYSSILPCFLPSGIKSAISKAKARKLFVCNIMNKRGETNGFSVEDFALEVEKYIGGQLDFVLYNNKVLENDLLKIARKADVSLLDQVAWGGLLDKNKFVGSAFLKRGGVLHDGKKLTKMIWKLIS
jgi:uncharacterized cofD-like protein